MNHHVDTDDTRIGTTQWVQRTSGRLTATECRALLRALARTHAQNAVGRLRLAATTYTCPMHPDVVSDSPDRCPSAG